MQKQNEVNRWHVKGASRQFEFAGFCRVLDVAGRLPALIGEVDRSGLRWPRRIGPGQCLGVRLHIWILHQRVSCASCEHVQYGRDGRSRGSLGSREGKKRSLEIKKRKMKEMGKRRRVGRTAHQNVISANTNACHATKLRRYKQPKTGDIVCQPTLDFITCFRH